jgi:hypothetical protein
MLLNERTTLRWAPLALAGLACGADRVLPVSVTMTKAELMDPAACQTCHPQQYQAWSGSMHAYAAEDPVFLAMNQRGQRETGGALGDFCVGCHAPVALREGLTTDGLNLPSLPAAVKGVTCYFCHSTASVDGTHNNPLTLTTDGTLFGPFADPAPGTPHKSTYSPFFDPSRPESAHACGSCHDIVNQHGANVERTFSEWQETLFSDLRLGQTCVRCHMNQSQGRVSTESDKIRSLGSHALPGVDVALTPFPEMATQKQQVQSLLDGTLAGTLCLTTSGQIEVSLDNVSAGHSVSSGAAADRRVWAEVKAYRGGEVIYQSGVVPPGQSVETIDDPDLWLIRDCLFDESGAPTHMFWEAASATSNLIPGPVPHTVEDPELSTRSHAKYLYPRASRLPAEPDRITLQVYVKPIGDEILQDLVATGDLDPAIAAAMPTFSLQDVNLEWTAAKGKAPVDSHTRMPVPGLSCVTTSPQYYTLEKVHETHAHCGDH